jgi:hypothetical protein
MKVNPVFTWLPHDSEGGPAGDGTAMGLRPLAVALLCGMAHSTQRTRHELWSHNGLELLLQLLREEVRHPCSLSGVSPGKMFCVGLAPLGILILACHNVTNNAHCLPRCNCNTDLHASVIYLTTTGDDLNYG